jgi:hypothetical protein
MDYSFDEFVSHFKALAYVGKYETVDLCRGDERKHIDLASTNLDPGMLKVMDYMGQCFTDEAQKLDKGYRIYRVIHYLRDHRDELAKSRFASLRKESGHIDMHVELLMAIHELVYCSNHSRSPSPRKVLARAHSIWNSSRES